MQKACVREAKNGPTKREREREKVVLVFIVFIAAASFGERMDGEKRSKQIERDERLSGGRNLSGGDDDIEARQGQQSERELP